MRIGLDIDNVISNFDDILLKEYLKHDKELRNTGIINENAKYIREGMFDWSKEEELEFYYKNIERIAKSLRPISNAPKFIQKLKEDGNEIYIISGRNNGEYTNAREMTENWLASYHIPYNQLILTNAYDKQAKSIECMNHNIDIMIDDSIRICQNLKEHGIPVWLMSKRFNQYADGFEKVSSWKEIYAKISSMYKKEEKTEKLHVILDTDTYNECDDQFALSYLLTSQDRFHIEAVTVAPYRHDNDISIEEGTEKSYQEICKICNYLNFDTTNKVFKGSIDYISDGYHDSSDAVNKIIEVAMKNEKTYIIAIGAITNVAMAILKQPNIIHKIEVVWLGGNTILGLDNTDFNFRQDVQAVKTVFESQVKLTVIPCKGVASNLMISIYELEHYLKDKSELTNYLCSRFYNDGKHGIQIRRVIWDISAVAYLINKDWFEEKEISCPTIAENTSYELTSNRHNITMLTYLDSNKIYEDLFRKLGK